MPEGDSVAGHAERLRPLLEGQTIIGVEGTVAAVRTSSHRILHATVSEIRTVGKNLLIDLSTGYSVRVHLGMPGRWQIIASDQNPAGSARLVLTTERGRAVCHAAPTVEVDRTPAIDARVAGLGPDLLGEFDEDEFVRRARTRDRLAMEDLLLDQRVLAGIGNVYKSELLFLEGVHPKTPCSRVGDHQLRSITRRARKLLAANIGPGTRSTTGARGRGLQTWVYGRSGRPCRRCGHAIVRDSRGERVTYWCPTCQPRPSTSPVV
ncbi:MAG: DNA-formamidopyrimidine glycosylase family protein [Acidimicrobiia bacterium]|jgi:endonuclease-8